jgi:hypothetical protein
MDRKRVLDFFQRFYSADIDGLDDDALVAMMTDLDSISLITSFTGDAGDMHLKPDAQRYQPNIRTFVPFMKSIQDEFSEKYREIFDGIISMEPPKGWFKDWLSMSKVYVEQGITGAQKPHLVGAFFAVGVAEAENLTFDASVDIDPRLEHGFTKDGRSSQRWPENWRDTARVSVGFSSEHMPTALITAFLQAIDGLPPSAFKKCPGCGTYFVQPGKRERRYCTQACGVRYLNRLRYSKAKAKGGKEYAQLLEEGKKRSAKAYHRKHKIKKKS